MSLSIARLGMLRSLHEESEEFWSFLQCALWQNKRYMCRRHKKDMLGCLVASQRIKLYGCRADQVPFLGFWTRQRKHVRANNWR